MMTELHTPSEEMLKDRESFAKIGALQLSRAYGESGLDDHGWAS